MDEPDFVETWLQCFTANTKSKKLKDNKTGEGENDVFNLFLASAKCKAIMKISLMIYSKKLENFTIEEISEIIKKNMRLKKRLVVAE